jgi:hypothetical protein
MKTLKIVVYAALAIFHLTTVIVLSVGRGNFDFLLKLFNKLDLMMYGAYLGFILFATTILFDYLNQKSIKGLNKKHQDDLNELKAKLYDKKESEPQKTAPPLKVDDTNSAASDESAEIRED